MRARIAVAFLVATLLGSSAARAAPAPPAAGKKPNPPSATDLERIREEARTLAVLKIERPEGTCYWQILGSDALLRIPLKDSAFKAVLFSAHLAGDSLKISAAGENEPLETTPLGSYDLPFRGDGLDRQKATTADSLRFEDRPAWNLSTLPPRDFFKLGGIDGCCKCNLFKLTCCPSAGNCLSCGTCGDCCAD